MGGLMSVITRIDSKSKKNSGFSLVDSAGNVIATIAAVSLSANLSIETAVGYKVVKSNGAVLERKK